MRTVSIVAGSALVLGSVLATSGCEQRGLTWHGTGALAGSNPSSAIAQPRDRTHSEAASDSAAPNTIAPRLDGTAHRLEGTAHRLEGTAPREQRTAPSATAGRRAPGFGARQELGLGAKGAGLVRLPGEIPLLAVALESPGALLLIGADATGSPTLLQRLPADGWALPPVLVHGTDGRARVALASRETSVLSLYDPDSPDAAPIRVPLPAAPVALAAGDLGADGSEDLLVLTRDSTLIALDAAGTSRSLQLEGERGTFLHVAADGSGVHVGWQLPRGFSNVPAEAFNADADIKFLSLPGIPRAMTELDLDRDGDLEQAIAGGDAELWVFGMQGAADDPAGWRRFQTPGDLPIALLAADIDGDGDQELLTINRQDSNYGVMGEWSAAEDRFDLYTSEYAGQSPLDLALCDLNGDGALDLCIVGRDSAALGVTSGSGQAGPGSDPFLEASRLPVGTNPLAVAAADVDGDGRAEAVALCGGDGSLHVLGAPRPGAPIAPLASLALGDAPRRAVLTGGVGRTPRLAVLLSPTEGSRVLRLSADARGNFTPDALGPVALRAASDLAAHGVPEDAALVAVDPASRGLAVLPGSASEPTWFTLPHPAPSSIARLDGTRCLVAGGEQGRAWVALYRLPLDAGGSAAAPEQLAFVEFEGWPIDLDAAEDTAYLLLGTSAGLDHGRVRALKLGPDSLQAGPEAPTGARPARVAAGDLDRDGLVDVACAAQNSHRLELYFQRSEPAPRLAVGPRVSCGLGPLDVALADIDGDGWLDLLSANAFSHDVSAIRALPPH